MKLDEMKSYIKKNNLPSATIQIEKAEGIFEGASSLNKLEAMQAQQQINKCLKNAEMQIEAHKEADATRARFAAMTDSEIANENAQANQPPVNHSPLRELRTEELKKLDAAQQEFDAKQRDHEAEEHVDWKAKGDLK